MTIHAESISAVHGVETTDAEDIPRAFAFAAKQLAKGEDVEVKVWFSGDRNVPTTLTRQNYFEVMNTWVVIG